MIPTFIAAVAAYLLGCVVGAYYIVGLRRGHDVRETGSGTAGTRNVFRSGDRSSAALTLLWDTAKGAMAIALSRAVAGGDAAAALACVAVVAGHIWPAQLQFRGGKGLATAIGCLLALAPRARFATWPLVAGVAFACALVVFVHHPSIDRRRRVLSTRPAQENAP